MKQVMRASNLILDAELSLMRRLSEGERADLLLDNMSELKDSVAAHELLKQVSGYEESK